MVGLIGKKKNIRYHEKETVRVTADEGHEYLQELKKYWLQEGRSPRSFKRQTMDRAGGDLACIPQEVAYAALKRVTRKKWS